jgi:hypothetical protein
MREGEDRGEKDRQDKGKEEGEREAEIIKYTLLCGTVLYLDEPSGRIHHLAFLFFPPSFPTKI